jgi:glycosylphosphatidylinositol transamidase (GPIT) subunit GPI8
MYHTNVAEKTKTHFIFSNFFRKSSRLCDNMEKYGTAREATDDSIIRRMCFACRITKDTHTRARTFSICNIYWFSTTNLVTRMRLSFALILTLPLFSNVYFILHMLLFLSTMYYFSDIKLLLQIWLHCRSFLRYRKMLQVKYAGFTDPHLCRA